MNCIRTNVDRETFENARPLNKAAVDQHRKNLRHDNLQQVVLALDKMLEDVLGRKMKDQELLFDVFGEVVDKDPKNYWIVGAYLALTDLDIWDREFDEYQRNLEKRGEVLTCIKAEDYDSWLEKKGSIGL